MDGQSKPELQVSKGGRPKSNRLREGVTSKICYLCFGQPLSKYEVSIMLYGRTLANVQNWMNTLTDEGYLKSVTREVIHIPGRRPKGKTGFQLIASKIVEEMDRTLAQNTHDKLRFTVEEKARLSDFLDSGEARAFIAATKPDDLGSQDSYDLCSLLSTIFWSYTSSRVKLGPASLNPEDLHRLDRHIEDPRFDNIISKAVKRADAAGSAIFGTSEKETGHFNRRFQGPRTLLRLVKFSFKLSDFVTDCSDEFLEKLCWSGLPALPTTYGFLKLADQLPSLLKGVMRDSKVQELMKAIEGEDV